MGDIRAIETYYKGYRFRSRLEARWAVFFDTLGIRYQYEQEGFELNFLDGKIKYSPDFYLPQYGLYAEVKGIDFLGEFSKEDAEKMAWMIDFAGPCKNGVILLGNIPDPHTVMLLNWLVWFHNSKCHSIVYSYGEYPPIANNLEKGRVIGCWTAPSNFLDEKDMQDYFLTYGIYAYNDPELQQYRSQKLENALTAARQARFEYGETPIPVRR